MIVFTRTVSAGWALNMLHGLLEIHSMLLENYNFQNKRFPAVALVRCCTV